MASKQLNKKECLKIGLLVLANVISHLIGAGVFMYLEKESYEKLYDISKVSGNKSISHATSKAEPTPEAEAEPKSEPEPEGEPRPSTFSAREMIEKVLKSKLNSTDFHQIQLLLKSMETAGTNAFFMPKWKSEISWGTYVRWLCFTAATVSTIGYGNITPQCNESKIFLIPYVLVAIPLHLSCLGFVGKLIGMTLRALIRFVEIKILKRTEVNREEMKCLISTFMVMWFWLIFGTIATEKITHWRFLDSFYFMFVTYTTIGYGDYVVGTVAGPTYDGLMLMHSIVGLALVAGVLDGIVNVLVKKQEAETAEHKSATRESVWSRSNNVFPLTSGIVKPPICQCAEQNKSLYSMSNMEKRDHFTFLPSAIS